MIAPTSLGELLAECEVRDIRLLAASDGSLRVDAPNDGLTEELLARLRARRQEILSMLQPTAVKVLDRAREDSAQETESEDMGDIVRGNCRCGATIGRDVPIHDGRSVRRDCAACGRFLDFPVWYGVNTVRNEQ